MLNQEVFNSLKIPEYCLKRRGVKGVGELEKSEVHALTDEYWDSPRITPNFGDENCNSIINQKLSRIPRIHPITRDKLENFGNTSGSPKPFFGTNRELSSIISKNRICNEDYIESFNDEDTLTPLASSAARYRLYDIEWDEKSKFEKDKENSKNVEIEDSMKLEDADFCLLDSIGIKGLKEFETHQGKVTVTEDGDFSFEFSNRKKLFTVKGGGCFVVVSDIINNIRNISVNPSFESTGIASQKSNESKYHISELPPQHLKRYIYGVHLCETIKSFIPKVKLKIPREGTYFLMSNHSTFADFRAEFSSVLKDLVLSVHLTNYQSTIIFTSKSGKRIEFQKYVLDRMGVYEEVDQAFEEIKYNDYLIKKSYEISECGIKWSNIINIWRLILNRLVDCKNLELKGLKAYSELLISSEVDLIHSESSPFGEICTLDWHIRKNVFENIFPVQVEEI
ncbi:uncharacterized protein cubi_00135 [Cryptosporidium ubiquitum]|uniref:Uncharacterized protein n=1 Tax=Cryptosporidium ubiquitum TaxID=857276 RepID=A0A1J4MK48_9CRYT|nr:uncharacterized protein cubi_00135 [Cryptosporidium ubiquitum]OII74582.1 hypothetical protein cubi_00135 [Cryptosporidium ubiquitum]